MAETSGGCGSRSTRPPMDCCSHRRRHLRSNNSCGMHNPPALAGGTNRCTLLIHPDDAARLRHHRDRRRRRQVAVWRCRWRSPTPSGPGRVAAARLGSRRAGHPPLRRRHSARVNFNSLLDSTPLEPLSGNLGAQCGACRGDVRLTRLAAKYSTHMTMGRTMSTTRGNTDVVRLGVSLRQPEVEVAGPHRRRTAPSARPRSPAKLPRYQYDITLDDADCQVPIAFLPLESALPAGVADHLGGMRAVENVGPPAARIDAMPTTHTIHQTNWTSAAGRSGCRRLWTNPPDERDDCGDDGRHDPASVRLHPGDEPSQPLWRPTRLDRGGLQTSFRPDHLEHLANGGPAGPPGRIQDAAGRTALSTTITVPGRLSRIAWRTVDVVLLIGVDEHQIEVPAGGGVQSSVADDDVDRSARPAAAGSGLPPACRGSCSSDTTLPLGTDAAGQADGAESAEGAGISAPAGAAGPE